MLNIDYRLLLIGAALLLVRPSGALSDEPPVPEVAREADVSRENAELKQRIATLEERVAALERELQLLGREPQRHRRQRIVPAPPEATRPQPPTTEPRVPRSPEPKILPAPVPQDDRRNWQERERGGLRFYIIPLERGQAEPR